MAEHKKAGRIGRWIARNLDYDTVSKIAPETYAQWSKTPDYYRGVGYKPGTAPPEAGDLLVQTPYADWYYLTWGIDPNADMPKWRWMYRARPEIRHGVDIMVILAIGRGFSALVENPKAPNAKEIETYANSLIDKLDMRNVLQSAVTDMLVYGTAYFEKVRSVPGPAPGQETQDYDEVNAPDSGSGMQAGGITRQWNGQDMDNPTKEKMAAWVADASKVDAYVAQQRVDPTPKSNGAPGFGANPNQMDSSYRKELAKDPFEGELVELKPLDPLWMRVARDAFGNVIGWLQWGLSPIPISIPNEKIVVLRWMPKSWARENAYGTSILMPVQRHISMIIQAEEDMKTWWHQYAKPMLAVYAGTPDKPYPMPAIQGLVSQFSNRQPNTDAVVPGDVKMEILKGAATDTANVFSSWSQYLREKIYETMGIPNVLMNLADVATRASSDVSLQAFIAYEEMIQQITGMLVLKQVLEPELLKKFGKVIPKMTIQWPPVLEEDRNQKIDRIVKATGVPFMTINEARAESDIKPIDNPLYDIIPLGPAAPVPEPGASPNTNPSSQYAPSKNPEQSAPGIRGEMKDKMDKQNVQSAVVIPSRAEFESRKAIRPLHQQTVQ
jgi:hypothetical protein